MVRAKRCIICESTALLPAVVIERVPVQCSALISTYEEALRATVGRVELVICETCGHTFNAAFQPDLVRYDGAYENSLDHSSVFQNYVETTARDLFSRHDLAGKRIVEIGCGQAGFLKAMCRLGAGECIGFDPSYSGPGGERVNSGRLRVHASLFTGEAITNRVDFVCSRQTLEHITEPVSFLSMISRAVEQNRALPVFFEVPNGAAISEVDAVWDIIYPHVSYFNANSLSRALQSGGFSVSRTYETFGRQFLCAEGANCPRSSLDYTQERPNAESSTLATSLAGNYKRIIAYWRNTINDLASRRQKVVVWGSGAKGVTFLNAIGNESGIRFAVDINPRRQGRFIPGAGQEIVAPEFLKRYRPHVVILMNPIYTEEVASVLAELEVRCELLVAGVADSVVGVA